MNPKVLISLLTLSLGAILTGCTSKTGNDTSIPWSRPAGWEGQVPGMGSSESGQSGTGR